MKFLWPTGVKGVMHVNGWAQALVAVPLAGGLGMLVGRQYVAIELDKENTRARR